ncbi:MAG: ribosomal protein S18-alanine N-acetyltransferase [Variibacter sp.]
MIVIRPAKPIDIEPLYALERAAFATDRLSRRSFRRQLAARQNGLVVAEVEGALAGYALVLLRLGSRTARLYSIAVRADHETRGVGWALLAAAEQAAAERGCEAMRLEVHASNRRAAQLYERAGYRAFARIERYYEDGGSAVRYEKRLAARKAV